MGVGDRRALWKNICQSRERNMAQRQERDVRVDITPDSRSSHSFATSTLDSGGDFFGDDGEGSSTTSSSDELYQAWQNLRTNFLPLPKGPTSTKSWLPSFLWKQPSPAFEILSTPCENPCRTPILNTRSLASVNFKLKVLPKDCLDRSLWELFKHFKYDFLNSDRFDKDYALKCLENIEKQAKQEEVSGCVFNPNLRHVKKIVTNHPMDQWDSEKIANLLYYSIKDIYPIDIELLIDLITEGEVPAETVMGKDVLFLFGVTGAGKTTTIHHLCGSKFEKAQVDGHPHLKVVQSHPALGAFENSAGGSSKSLFVNGVDVKFEGKEFTIADSPGMGENRGSEAAIANGVCISSAMRTAKSVIPVNTFSYLSQGDKQDKFVSSVELTLHLLHGPISQHTDSFQYIFTKYPNGFKNNDRIFKIIDSKLKSLNSDTPSDVKTVVKACKLRLGENKNCAALVVDPIKGDRNALLRELIKGPARIENPSQVFKNYIPFLEEDKLRKYLEKRFKKSMSSALKERNLDQFVFKMKQLVRLAAKLDLEICNLALSETKKMVEDECSTLLKVIQEKIISCVDFNFDADQVKVIMGECITSIDTLGQLDKVCSEFCEDSMVSYTEGCYTSVLEVQQLLSEKILVLLNSDVAVKKSEVDKCLIFLAKMDQIRDAISEAYLSDQSSTLFKKLSIRISEILNLTTHSLEEKISTALNDFDVKDEEKDISQLVTSLSKMKTLFSFLSYREAELPHKRQQYNQAKDKVCIKLEQSFEYVMKLFRSKNIWKFEDSEIMSLHEAFSTFKYVADSEFFVEEDRLLKSSFTSFFTRLQESLHSSMKVESHIQTIFMAQKENNPFQQIQFVLSQVHKVRNNKLIFAHTVDSYGSIEACVMKLIGQLSNELMADLKYLQSSGWKVASTSKRSPSEVALRIKNLSQVKQLVSSQHNQNEVVEIVSANFVDEYLKVEHVFVNAFKELCDAITEANLSYEDMSNLSLLKPCVDFTQSLANILKNDSNVDAADLLLSLKDIEDVFSSKLDVEVSRVVEVFIKSANKQDVLEFDRGKYSPVIMWNVLQLVSFASEYETPLSKSAWSEIETFGKTYFEEFIGTELSRLFKSITNEDNSDHCLKKRKQEVRTFMRIFNHLQEVICLCQNQHRELGLVESDLSEGIHHIALVTNATELFRTWMDPGQGTLFARQKYLESVVQSDTVQLSAANLEVKWEVAQALSLVDGAIQIPTEGYGDFERMTFRFSHLATEFKTRIDTHLDGINQDIEQGNYEKVGEFLSNHSNTTDNANLEKVKQKLGLKLTDVLEDIKKCCESMDISPGSFDEFAESIKAFNTFVSAEVHVFKHLDSQSRNVFEVAKVETKKQLVECLHKFYRLADQSLADFKFKQFENILQEVQRLVGSLFDESSNTNDGYLQFVSENFELERRSDVINIEKKRREVEKVVTYMLSVFEQKKTAAIKACKPEYVLDFTEISADVTNTELSGNLLGAGDEQVGSAQDGWLSTTSTWISKIKGIVSVSRAEESQSQSQSLSSRDISSLPPPPPPELVRSASSQDVHVLAKDQALFNLQHAFSSDNSPKLFESRLSKAMEVGSGTMYEKRQQDIHSSLKEYFRELIDCCNDKLVQFEVREELIEIVNDLLKFMPECIESQFTSTLTECKEKLQADIDTEHTILAENENSERLIENVEAFVHCYNTESAWQPQFAGRQLSISRAIFSLMVRLEQDLKTTNNVSTVLMSLRQSHKAITDYFDVTTRLSRAKKYIQFLKNNFSTYKFYDDNCRIHLETILASSIQNGFQAFCELSRDDPRLFQEMSLQFDVYRKLNELRFSDCEYDRGLYERLRSHEAFAINTMLSKMISVFCHFNTLIVTLTNSSKLDHLLLKETMEQFSRSDAIHEKLLMFIKDGSVKRSDKNNKVLDDFNLGDGNCRSFTAIKSEVDNLFTRISDSAKPVLRHGPHEDKLTSNNTEDRVMFYQKLYNVYSSLSHLSDLKVYTTTVHSAGALTQQGQVEIHLLKQLNDIEQFLGELLQPKLLKRDFVEFAVWLDNLRCFSEAFSTTVLNKDAKDILNRVQRKFLHGVFALVESAETCDDTVKLVNYLYELKGLSECCSMMKEQVDRAIDRLLENIRDVGESVGKSDSRLKKVTLMLVKPGENHQQLANKIVSDHSIFKEVLLERFNRKVSTCTIENVIESCEGDELDENRKSTILELYNIYSVECQALIEKYLSNPGAGCEKCINDALIVVSEPTLSSAEKSLRLITVLSAYWTFSHSMSSSPNEQKTSSIQNPVSSLSAAEDNENDDSDGRSCAENTDTENWQLLRPHPGQIFAIFRLLGLDNGSDIDDVNMVNHFMQIHTGEGKSIVVAMVACVLALQGFTVHSACYSQYLTKRDYKAFLGLFRAFGVSDYIMYKTFPELCETLLNETCNIRDAFLSVIDNSEKQDGSGGGGGGVGGGGGGGEEVSLSSVDKRPVALLIDEVDTFFKRDFYGNSYRPLAKLQGPEVTAFLDIVWSMASKTLNPAQVRQTTEYNRLVARYPHFKSMLDEHVKTMVVDLKSFESMSESLKIDKDCIFYKSQDGLSDKINYGYKTTWSYYKGNKDGLISQKSLMAQKFMGIDIGSFSFAEIPRQYYQLILGVSGTLNSISSSEKEVLRDFYDVKKLTFMPSVYGSNKLRFQKSHGDDIKIEVESGYLTAITNEIKLRRGVARRPVIVICENKADVDEYLKSEAATCFKSIIRVITELTPEPEKEDVIRQATNAGSITVISSEFGRGTDFICYGDDINEAGGVHVLQVYLSTTLAEEKQNQGRTARQGAEGTYSMLLSQSRLEKFGISEEDVKRMKDEPNKAYEFLHEKRCNYFKNEYHETIQQVQHILADHKECMEVVNLLTNQVIVPVTSRDDQQTDFDRIQKFLFERNRSTVQEIVCYHTLILLDSTFSMDKLISETKSKLNIMFSQIREICRDNGISDSSFKIKIGGYRNYDAVPDKIYEHSSYESDPENLSSFLAGLVAENGWGNEAMEIGLWDANRDAVLYGDKLQVIVIGDAPPNTKVDVSRKRREGSHTSKYASHPDYCTPTHVDEELVKLKEAGVPVHTFYLDDEAANSFKAIARCAGPDSVCAKLNIESEGSADGGEDKLSQIITERILIDVGGRGEAGEKLAEACRNKFYNGKGYVS